MVSSLTGRQFNYFGSDRWFYSGLSVGSSTSWAFVNFSGLNSGFGSHSHEEGARFMINSSGTSVCQWSWDSGVSIAGEVWAGDAATFDGVARSGVWIRAASVSQGIQLFYW